jgi:hypothetical protein
MAKKETSKNKVLYQCPQCVKEYPSAKMRDRHVLKHKVEAKKLKDALDPREEGFCKLYASDRQFFGNGTQSYMEAFDVQLYQGKKPNTAGNWMTYMSVRDAASTLLTNTHILRRINEIFEGRGLNDTFVDKQLELVLTQNADMPSKVRAIAEYNKLKSRITQKIAHTFEGDPTTEAEIDALLAEGEAFFKKKKLPTKK